MGKVGKLAGRWQCPQLPWQIAKHPNRSPAAGLNGFGLAYPTAGLYRYTRSLRMLDGHLPPRELPVPPRLQEVRSPLRDHIGVWAQRLAWHPDAEFADYVLSGLQHGFRVGFAYSSPHTPAKRNMRSALSHSHIIDSYIAREHSAGRFIGPLSPGESHGLHVNRFGVIPKGHTGKWRLITDLSFPEGASVNDGTDRDLCSLRYTSVERVAQVALQLGPGALLVKLDVKSAYRLLPVHPEDRWLLGVCWRDQRYVDTMLPFGLRSAPKIFTAVADALEWCFHQEGVAWVDHYLDDYITMGPPRSLTCQAKLDSIMYVCEQLGVPLAVEKLAGPTSCIEFLCIEIDTVEGVLRLPQDKLRRLQETLRRWSRRRACRRKKLESLIGILQHAATVIKPGRTFLRHMIGPLGVGRGSSVLLPERPSRLHPQDLWGGGQEVQDFLRVAFCWYPVSCIRAFIVLFCSIYG